MFNDENKMIKRLTHQGRTLTNEEFHSINNDEEHDIEILLEASLTASESKLPKKIWVDGAGISRNKPDNMPRIKVEFTPGNRSSISIPRKVGEEPIILATTEKRKHDLSTKKDIFDFIMEYNDILLMCYNLDSPIFEGYGSMEKDKIIKYLLINVIKYGRTRGIAKVIQKYNPSVDGTKFIPDKYKKLANNSKNRKDNEL